MNEFSSKLEHGQAFEKQFAEYLTGQGWTVIPNYEQGSRPTTTSGLVLPDLLVFKDGLRFWVECKRKPRMRKHPATGFETRLHEDYRKVQAQTQTPVYLVFQDGAESYGQFLSRLTLYRTMLIEGREHKLFHVDGFRPIDLGKDFLGQLPIGA